MKTHPFPFVAALVLLTLAAAVQSVHAQTSYTLIVDGIQGDSASPNAGLAVRGWTFGVEHLSTGGGGGGGGGRASFEEVVVTKTVDSSSPLLMKACTTQQHIPTAVLKGTRKGAKQEYLLIKMTDVVITSVSLSGTSGKPATMENVSLSFRELEYIVRKKSGEESKFTWNLVTNQGS